MGIFSKKIKEKPITDFLKIIDGFSSVFMPFSADKMQSDIWTSAAQSNANHRSKLKLVHRLKGKEQLRFQRILQLRPNPIMNSTVFLESLSLDYDLYNNAFIYIDRDDLNGGEVIGLWRINPSVMSVGADDSGSILCRFTLQGKTYTVPFSRICHIGRMITKDEIFGDDNSAINKILGIINTNYQGIEAAIKTSGILRYLVTIKEKTTDKQLRAKEKEFRKTVLDPLNAGGVKFLDIAAELKELNPGNQKYGNFAEQGLYAKQVYNFLGTSESIINGTNTDDQMIAFYERTVDTFALKLQNELTYKVFTARELDFLNEIEAVPNRLAFMSMARRIEIARIVREVGVLNKGAFADLLFIPIDEEIRNEPLPVSQNYSHSGGGDGAPVPAPKGTPEDADSGNQEENKKTDEV